MNERPCGVYDNYRAYDYFGCHLNGNGGAVFRVWAPRARRVAVIGDFNGWNADADLLYSAGNGVWEGEVKGVKVCDGYKFLLDTPSGRLYKADPYAFFSETRQLTNSKVYRTEFGWSDDSYMQARRQMDIYSSPVNIYEVHIGSWRRDEQGESYSYRRFAHEIAAYQKKLLFTHVELMGIAEYPLDASWGYQVTGYFAPTSRYGTPADFAYMIDFLHANGIGVILDWVPGHFPKNAAGLYRFDGAPLYEPEGNMGEHKEWGTCAFDYSRPEVKSFLISNAAFWFDVYHIDGLRVDAVASMLYLDYGRRDFTPNAFGGNENLEAAQFLRELNTVVFGHFGGIMMIAEESTAYAGVTLPVHLGGLGFNFKWNMGWMHDTLSYAAADPLFRRGLHNNLTFAMTYAHTENFILPVSHDEVVYGKRSLLGKMSGTYDDKFACFRLYLMFMYAHPGKKLLFMGSESAQFDEWDFNKELCRNITDYPRHREAFRFVGRLFGLYAALPPLFTCERGFEGFVWRQADDRDNNVVIFERFDRAGGRVLCVFNFSPVARRGYRVACERGTYYLKLATDLAGVPALEGRRLKAVKGEDGCAAILDIPAYGGMYFYKRPKKRRVNKEVK